jgi:hypothetical protein
MALQEYQVAPGDNTNVYNLNSAFIRSLRPGPQGLALQYSQFSVVWFVGSEGTISSLSPSPRLVE